jgi:hypothetical protein
VPVDAALAGPPIYDKNVKVIFKIKILNIIFTFFTELTLSTEKTLRDKPTEISCTLLNVCSVQ